MDLKALYAKPEQGKHLTKRRPKKRVGRGIGSGMGKTSTRGHKGQWASAGADKPSFTFEGGQMPLFRRMPKRGFSNETWNKHYHVVNVADLGTHFEDGAVVDQEALKKAGLAKGVAAGIRVLGFGEIKKKLTVKASHFSKSAAEKIAAAGGTAEVLPGPKPPVRNKMKPKKQKPSKT